MSDWLRSLIIRPASTAIPEVVRRFGPPDATLSRDNITVDGKSWLVDAQEEQVVRLFEVPDPDVEQCLLIYRASLKSESLRGRAFLEMWCRLPGQGEFFSRGLNQTIKGTTDWASYEIPFRLKSGQRPDLIKLNLAIEGQGRVWIKDVELLKTPK
jgi:hypothetical protein